MSPEFIAILEEREQLVRLLNLFPLVLGIIAFAVSAITSRKFIAFLLVTCLAIFSIAMSVIIFENWWFQLEEVATTYEDQAWLLDHDGGGFIIQFIFATVKATLFWIIAMSVLFVRGVITLFRKPNRGELQV